MVRQTTPITNQIANKLQPLAFPSQAVDLHARLVRIWHPYTYNGRLEPIGSSFTSEAIHPSFRGGSISINSITIDRTPLEMREWTEIEKHDCSEKQHTSTPAAASLQTSPLSEGETWTPRYSALPENEAVAYRMHTISRCRSRAVPWVMPVSLEPMIMQYRSKATPNVQLQPVIFTALFFSCGQYQSRQLM